MNARTLSVIVTIALAIGSGVRADVITDWNDEALDAIRATRTPPPPATRALAMVHVAMFDALNGMVPRYEPYHVKSGGLGASRTDIAAAGTAAAASAADVVLSALFPARRDRFKAALADSHAGLPATALRNGRRWGQFVGGRILALRSLDGSTDFVDYRPSGRLGAWQPTPPAFAPALLPQWPRVTPFAMRHGAQFRAPAPPPFSSLAYAQAYAEVTMLGGAISPERTADQTEIAYFWEDGAGTVTPPGHWQVIAQQLAATFHNDVMQNARLFALLSMVQADAAIASWDTKYAWDHVRPYTAITEEADDDGNPATEADPAWSSLIPTPPFPAYTSGHSTFSGSSARLLARFFGRDDIAFAGPSPDPNRWPDELPGVVRSWASLSQAAEEAGQSRVYGGIHWQYDNQEGLRAGRALADWVFDHFLRPRR